MKDFTPEVTPIYKVASPIHDKVPAVPFKDEVKYSAQCCQEKIDPAKNSFLKTRARINKDEAQEWTSEVCIT